MAKTKDITLQIDRALDQAGSIVDKLYTAIKTISFSGELSENSLNKLRLHLGYSKNYSDLAKTRLNYRRMSTLMDDEENG